MKAAVFLLCFFYCWGAALGEYSLGYDHDLAKSVESLLMHHLPSLHV